MSQLDDFQNNLKVAKRRYKKALKSIKRPTKGFRRYKILKSQDERLRQQ